MLRVEGVTKRYGETVALDGVDLVIEPGEICALLGPNGAGKTTLASIVTGLLRADSGTVAVDGRVLPDNHSRTRIGFAPQELGVYLPLTVTQNLTFFGELAGLRGAELARARDEVAEALTLTELLARKVATLSGGEMRRVHTAAAMLHRPPLLLLDEPTTGVDVRTRAALLDAVRALAAEGTAICYSTHYLEEVETIGATVAIIDHGRMVTRGLCADLIAQHGTAAVELVFDGPPPPLDGGLIDGDLMRFVTGRPTDTLAAVLGMLGDDAGRLRKVDIVTPSLESVFLTLTGRRFDVAA